MNKKFKYIIASVIGFVLSASVVVAAITLPPTTDVGSLLIGTSTTRMVNLPTSTPGYVLMATGTAPYVVWAPTAAGAGTLSGNGTSTQVAFYTALQTLSSSINLFWDNVNSRLGISSSTPGYPLTINGLAYTTGIKFPTSSPAWQPGLLFYEQGTANKYDLTFYNNDSNVALQIGKENWKDVRNCNTGATIPNGAAVYRTGVAISQKPCVAVAYASTTNTNTADVIGVATEDILNNADGLVTTFGLVNGLNTSGFADGDNVYLYASSTGGILNNLTNVKPSYPQKIAHVGEIDYSYINAGVLEVSIFDEHAFADANDVNVAGAATGTVLMYDGTAWTKENTLFVSGSNIGIGTSTPQTPLHVIGQTTISSLGTGLVKSTAGLLGNATSGTDYQAPVSFPIPVASTSLSVSATSGLALNVSTLYNNGVTSTVAGTNITQSLTGGTVTINTTTTPSFTSVTYPDSTKQSTAYKYLAFNVYNTSSTTSVGASSTIQKIIYQASTLTQIDCSTDGSSITLQSDYRASSTPQTYGTSTFTGLVCSSTGASTTTFSNANIPANSVLNFWGSSVPNSTTTLRVNFVMKEQ